MNPAHSDPASACSNCPLATTTYNITQVTVQPCRNKPITWRHTCGAPSKPCCRSSRSPATTASRPSGSSSPASPTAATSPVSSTSRSSRLPARLWRPTTTTTNSLCARRCRTPWLPSPNIWTTRSKQSRRGRTTPDSTRTITSAWRATSLTTAGTTGTCCRLSSSCPGWSTSTPASAGTRRSSRFWAACTSTGSRYPRKPRTSWTGSGWPCLPGSPAADDDR